MGTWPLLQRAFRKAQGTALGDRMDEAEILQGLCSGMKDLLIAKDTEAESVDGYVLGGVILEFVQRPKGKCCIVVASLFNSYHHPDGPRWSHEMNRHVIDYARDECGCYAIEAYAREGVLPVLERLGWRRKATVMEIRL